MLATMFRRFLLATLTTCVGFLSTHAQEADLVYTGGDILTMRGNTPEYVELLAVKDGKIAFAGSGKEGASRIGPRTRRIDLAGRTLLPACRSRHGSADGCERR